MAVPIITIVTRHSATCSRRGNEQYQRCDCWKHLRWFENGRLHWKATKERTWAGAERAKQAKLHTWEEEAMGKPAPRAKMTVAEAAALYIADKKQQGLDVGTISKNKRTVDRLVEFCDRQGINLLTMVTSEHLIAYRATWEWYEATESRKNEQTRLKSFFRWAHAHDFTPKNPAAQLSSIKGDREQTKPFEPEEMKAIVAAIPDSGLTDYASRRVRALALLMRHSGLSIIDAASLAREELQQTGKDEYAVMRRRLKTGILVTNPLPTEVATELLALTNSNPKYFFWTGKGSEKTIAGKFTNQLQKVFVKAEIADGHAHRFRDTAAVELLKAGVDIRDVQKFLGHSSLATTEE
ncbi:MAG: tyrosine-type recombinase/integrase, partial [Candidatus Sulfotelmatobacter sp.]